MRPRVKQGQYGDISVITRLHIWSDEKWNTAKEPEATVGMECSPVDGTVVSWYPFHNMFLPPTLPPRYPGVFVAIYLGIIEHRHTLTDWRPGSFSSPLSLSLSAENPDNSSTGQLTTIRKTLEDEV